MATLKNIHRLNFSEADQIKLEKAAGLHKRYSNIEFKLLEVKPGELIVRVTQGKHLSENYADDKRLRAIAKELFQPFFDGKIHVHAIPYKEHFTAVVTPEWLSSKLHQYQLRIIDIESITGLDKTNISAWVNGKRPMSQIVKAMFFFLFLGDVKNLRKLARLN